MYSFSLHVKISKLQYDVPQKTRNTSAQNLTYSPLANNYKPDNGQKQIWYSTDHDYKNMAFSSDRDAKQKTSV